MLCNLVHYSLITLQILRVPREESRDRWISNHYPLIEAGKSCGNGADRWAAQYDWFSGTLNVRRLALSVPPEMDGDETAVA